MLAEIANFLLYLDFSQIATFVFISKVKRRVRAAAYIALTLYSIFVYVVVSIIVSIFWR